ncbi:MAG: hypothetical protein KDB27_29085 [Planctomycetales bacterium]|nr:hypothetical protein [Planctomycetales bacterium]
MRSIFCACVCSLFIASASHSSIIVTVGDVQLQPNEANQAVPILVSSPDNTPAVAAFNLVAQLGDGVGGSAEPKFSGAEDTLDGVDFLTGTIWPASSTTSGTGPVMDFPYFATASVAIEGGGTTVADGILVTLFVDTTGFDSGTYDLLVSASQGNDSAFVLPGGSEFSPEIRNGSITIVPEPTACGLFMVFVVVGLARGSKRIR